MKRALTLVAFFLVGLSASPGDATICIAEDITLRKVRGVVVMDDVGGYEVLPGARVRMTRGRFSAEAISDEDGYFRFRGLRPGNYELHAELEGFLATVGEVKVRTKGAWEGRVLVVELAWEFDGCGHVGTEDEEKVREIQLEAKKRRRGAGSALLWR